MCRAASLPVVVRGNCASAHHVVFLNMFFQFIQPIKSTTSPAKGNPLGMTRTLGDVCDTAVTPPGGKKIILKNKKFKNKQTNKHTCRAIHRPPRAG